MSTQGAAADAYRHELTEQLRLADAEVARCERQLEGLEVAAVPNKEAAMASLRSALEAAHTKRDATAALWAAAVQADDTLPRSEDTDRSIDAG